MADWRDGIGETAPAMLTLPTHANVAGKARVIDGDTIEIAMSVSVCK